MDSKLTVTKARATVLVIADEENNHSVYQRISESLDLEFVTAISGQEALDVVQAHDFFLILMNVQMSDTDVFETASLLSKHPETCHIPIIFITFGDGDEDEDEVFELKAYACGAVDYLVKPINDEILKSKLGVFLKLYQDRLALAQSCEAGKKVEEELRFNKEQLEDVVEQKTSELQSSIEKFAKAETHLAQSDKMASLGRLVAGVVHDLNTPIGVCITGASFLQEILSELIDIYNQGKIRKQDLDKFIHSAPESTEIILANLDRALELISSFKLVAVDVSCDMNRRFNLHEYIIKVLQSLRPVTKRGSHEVFVEGDSSLMIESNPGAISQIVTNLVMNSVIHAFDEIKSGRIIIHITEEQDSIRVLYTDNGKGMSEEQLKRVFEAFYTTTRDSGGSGLGMYMVYNLVTEKLKGEVKCFSELGKGIQVDIYLPRDANTNLHEI